MKSNDTLDYLGAVNYQSVTHSTEMKKLRAGFLIKEILDRFKSKTLSSLNPNRTLWIYAAHGSVISNVLNSLDLFDVILFQLDHQCQLHFNFFSFLFLFIGENSIVLVKHLI